MAHALLRAAFTTASAEDNKSVFAQGIETSDIENHSNYDGKAISVGLNIGKAKDTGPQASLNGIGYGTDGDSDTSTTFASITGMAGQSEVTTANKDSLNEPLENVFDASTVNEELGAQVEITRAFGQEAPKAVGDFASNREMELLFEGNTDEAKKWGDGGAYRVALHTVVGALATGSIEGTFSSGVTAVTVPALRKYMDSQNIDETTQEAVLLGLSAGIGARLGGDTASTVTSFNQTDNNYLKHNDIIALGEQIKRALKAWNDAEVNRLLNNAIDRSIKLNEHLTKENEVYIDSLSDYPNPIIDSDKLTDFFHRIGVPSKYDTKIRQITVLQTSGQNIYKNQKNKFLSTDPELIFLYPYETGYGSIPDAYGINRAKVNKIKRRNARGANALLAIGSSPAAATLYGGAKIIGASDETSENIAIGSGLVANTATSGATGRVATTGKVILNKDNRYIVRKVTKNGQGRVKIEAGAKPDTNEYRAIDQLSKNGLNITFQRTASEKGISNERTADTHIDGFGQVDIITTASTKATSIVRRIEKKDTQAPSVYINLPLDSATQKEVADRVYGKPNIKNINTILFENIDGSILIIKRNDRKK